MTGTPPQDQSSESSFEEIFTKLRESIEALEGTELSLEEAVQLYEEGMQLAHKCNQILNNAELRISKLQEEYTQEPDEGSDITNQN